jgi:plasmid stabilization system protein ParE
MTGGINLTPEAERQLNEIDDWIARSATGHRSTFRHGHPRAH